MMDDMLEQLFPEPQTAMSRDEERTIYIAAGDPACNEESLNHYSRSDSVRIRCRVAENPATPVLLLIRLCSDPEPAVREAVAENLYAPEMLLQSLADDECCDVRYNLADNPRMPDSILTYLCDDDNPYVACRARYTFNHKHASGSNGTVVHYQFLPAMQA